jgi:hypothetical protein
MRLMILEKSSQRRCAWSFYWVFLAPLLVAAITITGSHSRFSFLFAILF